MVGITVIIHGIITPTATDGVIIGVCIRIIIHYPIIRVFTTETIQAFRIPIIHAPIDLNQGVEVIA